ncbi:MAG: methylmalonyl Co-A mutase-associated GTPase MeaB [Candidatus Kapabacteria bacterium]|nr:methylmalonyl Co-A mutase-associated GTPase MeaB [Candidatus Kapabacteria bacterium]
MPAATVDAIVQDLLAGNRRALARACSLVESTTEHDRQLATQLLERLLPHCVPSRRIGITGAPGVGKSTLVETFGLHYVETGRRVAVLAVDPSSRRTGGSILGDKVRMPRLSNHADAFVRPSPSRLVLGGATSTTREMILLCEAAGFDTVIVETVGVGQSEIDVADMVDMFLLLVLPTAGDDVQGIKRGIMEVADAVVVTKADLDAAAAMRAVAQYQGSLRYLVPANDDWTVPAIDVSSVGAPGLTSLFDAVARFFAHTRSGAIAERRHRQRSAWFDDRLHRSLIELVERDETLRTRLETLRRDIADGNVIPSTAVQRLLASINLVTKEPS